MQVGGAEIVAPFADAVGFVYGDAGEFALRVDGGEVPAEGVGEAELGGYVEETGEGVAAAEVIEDAGALSGRGGGVQGCDGDICGEEGGDLIGHEGEEGGDHDGDAMVDYGGELETEAFAKGSGGLNEDILAGEGGEDYVALVRPGLN